MIKSAYKTNLKKQDFAQQIEKNCYRTIYNLLLAHIFYARTELRIFPCALRRGWKFLYINLNYNYSL